jgi:hypothetical protein
MRTYTPELDSAVLERLRAYAPLFADDFPQAKPARWAGVYLQGLLLDGERKSLEPLSRRITLPQGLTSKDPNGLCSSSSIRAPGMSRRCCAATAPTWRRPSPARKASL